MYQIAICYKDLNETFYFNFELNRIEHDFRTYDVSLRIGNIKTGETIKDGEFQVIYNTSEYEIVAVINIAYFADLYVSDWFMPKLNDLMYDVMFEC